MALTKVQKDDAIAQFTNDLKEAKIVVYAKYAGTTVKELQDLRSQAREQGIKITVMKNRLVNIAISKTDGFKEAAPTLDGQLIYAIGSEDEVAPAQLIANFAKKHPQLVLEGAVNSDGELLDQASVTHLSTLPSKDQLRGQLVGTLAAPISGFVRVLNGNLTGLVQVLKAHQEKIA